MLVSSEILLWLTMRRARSPTDYTEVDDDGAEESPSLDTDEELEEEDGEEEEEYSDEYAEEEGGGDGEGDDEESVTSSYTSSSSSEAELPKASLWQMLWSSPWVFISVLTIFAVSIMWCVGVVCGGACCAVWLSATGFLWSQGLHVVDARWVAASWFSVFRRASRWSSLPFIFVHQSRC